jgi:hypothetical protein
MCTRVQVSSAIICRYLCVCVKVRGIYRKIRREGGKETRTRERERERESARE